MSEKRFRVRFEQENGRGEIVNKKGVELTAREVVDLLNEQQATITKLRNENIILKNKIEDLRVGFFIQEKELQRQMRKSGLDE